ncbi:hypothetical protein HPB51_025175 [Rhipicephalus microplus]|uniref:HTH CENPB-type domain-containing protein n=1 Tax=Rhipicephalus microplus TaxID=6941 RepID=A0A9J6E435_RHIMP|nr:hypothetical protein HPB51_025175 [Rhipicephalus microplus]
MRKQVYQWTGSSADQWKKVTEGLELPPDTLFYGEMVQEFAGETCEKLTIGTGSNLKRCRIRDSTYSEVEKALLLWLKKAQNMNLSGPLLTEKAQNFADQLNFPGFACSNGWLSWFQARYGIVGKAVCGEAAAADKQGAVEWQDTVLQEALTAYDAANIFNFDESALSIFHCLLPNRTLAFMNEKCSGAKHAKNPISVAFGVNMTSSEKLPLMVIGKYRNPWCLKSARLPSSFVYKHKKKKNLNDSPAVRGVCAPAGPPFCCQEKEHTDSTRQCIDACLCEQPVGY